jgi:two-component system, response regulator PdtaR
MGGASVTRIAALVVEDEPLVRFDLAQSLEAEGYETFEATNAADAIVVMEANPEIRVVFTDIQMPGTMDGLTLSHYVRKRWPPTIIVVSSGRCSPREHEMASGARFLPKPYVAQALISVLHDIRQQLRDPFL